MEKILKGSISTIRHAPKKAAKKAPRGTSLQSEKSLQGLQLFSKQLSTTTTVTFYSVIRKSGTQWKLDTFYSPLKKISKFKAKCLRPSSSLMIFGQMCLFNHFFNTIILDGEQDPDHEKLGC